MMLSLKRTSLFILSLVAITFCGFSTASAKTPPPSKKPTGEKNMKKNLYQYSANSLQGKKVDFSEYKGKVILVVNTASKCGLTPHYKGLETLYQKYKGDGFVVLGFPCNQFGKQEPGTSKEIATFCKENYGVSFPMFEKIEVNGKNTDPIYGYLKKELPGMLGGKIKWNFTKFLIDAEGNPIQRFAPTTKPSKIDAYIKKELTKKKS